MFSGIREKEEKTFTVRLTPDKEFSNEVAFRFSKKLGVVANNDLAGTPFYISLKDLKTVKIPQEDGKKKKRLGRNRLQCTRTGIGYTDRRKEETL